jgi:hypothetical protein
MLISVINSLTLFDCWGDPWNTFSLHFVRSSLGKMRLLHETKGFLKNKQHMHLTEIEQVYVS